MENTKHYKDQPINAVSRTNNDELRIKKLYDMRKVVVYEKLLFTFV
jgi:hypothetical protein